MSCINPIKIITKDGEEYKVPCGKCILCRDTKVKDWTIKLINESKYYKKACMITLTFDNKIILDTKSKAHKYGANIGFIWNIRNSKEYFQKFMKRLRKALNPIKIKYFRIGEYGDAHKRPHYHCILLGTDFDFDRKEIEKSKSGYPQYMSDTLTNCWAIGRATISEINSHTIGYTAGYSLKKYKYTQDKETYKNNMVKVKHQKTIEIDGIKKKITVEKWEYTYKPTMSYSNRAKMNAKWIRRNPQAIENNYLTDEDGKKYRIPKSYIDNLKKSDNKEHQYYLDRYNERLEEYIDNIDKDLENMRLNNKAKVLENKLKKLNRDF